MLEDNNVNLLKILRRARDQVLKEWDISFNINGEILSNIMSFTSDINTDIPIKFYNDKILIQLKSPDNIQYAEVEIGSSDVLDYKSNIEGDPNRKDAKSITKTQDGDFKGILIDIKGIIEEIESFVQKEDSIIVRIDSYYYKRIEFHCPGNIVIWAQLMDPSTIIKTVEKLPDTIKRVRNDPNIKKASIIVEPATFNRICTIGGKGKKRDIDERIFIELDKNDGLYITSGDKLKGRIFELKPMDIETGAESSENYYEEAIEDIDMGMTEEVYDTEESGYAPTGKGNRNNDKNRPDSKVQMDQLLGMDIDSTQYIYIDKEFILPFTKLKGLSPIVIEVRTDKPIILEQRPYNSIRAMLAIAPRMEDEDSR